MESENVVMADREQDDIEIIGENGMETFDFMIMGL